MIPTIFENLRAGVTTDSAFDTQAIGAEFAQALPREIALALHGDLGVGKTTFVQGLAFGFGIVGRITSPTFNIYTVHNGPSRTLLHLDAYRLETTAHIESLLLEDFLVAPWCLAVEWPDKIAAWLPAGTLHLDLGIVSDNRHTLRLR